MWSFKLHVFSAARTRKLREDSEVARGLRSWFIGNFRKHAKHEDSEVAHARGLRSEPCAGRPGSCPSSAGGEQLARREGRVLHVEQHLVPHGKLHVPQGGVELPIAPVLPGLAGSLGRSGRGAAKSSDPVGVAGRQKLLGVAYPRVRYHEMNMLGIKLMPPRSRNTFYTTEQHILCQTKACFII